MVDPSMIHMEIHLYRSYPFPELTLSLPLSLSFYLPFHALRIPYGEYVVADQEKLLNVDNFETKFHSLKLFHSFIIYYLMDPKNQFTVGSQQKDYIDR